MELGAWKRMEYQIVDISAASQVAEEDEIHWDYNRRSSLAWCVQLIALLNVRFFLIFRSLQKREAWRSQGIDQKEPVSGFWLWL